MNPLHFTLFESVVNYFASMIPYVVMDDAPSDYDSMCEYYYTTGALAVWSGASDTTIFSCAKSNHAFRAWHDFCHIRAMADFSEAGERRAMLMQIRMVSDLTWLSMPSKEICYKILQCEVMGQIAYHREHGVFPENQKELAIKILRGIL
jgi:hypothetical protein